MSKKFIGLWRLIPQACKYDVGQPPIKATYSFTPHQFSFNQQDPKHINVKIQWTDMNNKDFSTKYEIHLTGNKQLEEHFGVKMQLFHQVTPEGILKSTSFSESGQKVLMESFRQLKENDSILDVLMVTPTENGSRKIYQRYDRSV